MIESRYRTKPCENGTLEYLAKCNSSFIIIKILIATHMKPTVQK